MSTQTQAISWKKRLATLGVGYLGNKGQVIVFDYIMYPLVMWRLGLVWGAIVMSVLSFISCWGLIKLYDYLKVDWLGFELIKEKKENEKLGRFHRVLRWTLRKSDWLALILLSIYQDAFLTVAYLRHGANSYNGLSRRDWLIFVISWVISNGLWILVIFTGINAVEWVWGHVF